MKNETNGIDRFSKILMEARNSGIETLHSYIHDGWRPKNPDLQEKAVISLVEGLDADGRQRLIELVSYCTDISFFKLLSNLEEGAAGLTFQLVAMDESSDANFELINETEDNELRSKFWVWLEQQKDIVS